MVCQSMVAAEGELLKDRRLEPLKDLNGYFPFEVPSNRKHWEARAESLRRRVLVANGLWPMPEKTPLNAVIHGKIKREGFTVEKVYFESLPGFFVTGLLFRPDKEVEEKRPAVLSPHGHGGRLQDHGSKAIREHIVQGAERFEGSGRFPKVSRCAQLARMGCVTFLFDMIGYADNQQLSYELAHRFSTARPDFDTKENWGFYSTQAELRSQSIMGLQTWNAIRALDFLESLPDVDPQRIGVTGGSGGGTQTILLCAIDSRPAAAFPQGMVSTSMQGGCTCENTALLRIGTGNVELAGLFAPKPQAMTAANDWTKAMMSEGYPALQKLYKLYQAENQVYCKSLTHFPHNYNYVTRALMYSWFNQHLQLGLEEPIVEEDYEILSSEDHAVWNESHSKPEGGDTYEKSLTKYIDVQSERQLGSHAPRDEESLQRFRDVVGGAWEVLVGRALPENDEIEQEIGKQTEHEDYIEGFGKIMLESKGEVLPVVVFRPKAKGEDRFVIWLDGTGKQALYGEDGKVIPAIKQLLESGVSVVSADLFQQGKPLPSQNTLVKNPREYAGYTFGYNHPLFARRVHDVLTLIAAAKPDADQLELVGVNGAGVWVAAAAALARDVIHRVAIDTEGFRFADLPSYRDVNFLPGAVKYGDVPALLALGAPHGLWLGGESGQVAPVIQEAYNASGRGDQVASKALAAEECLPAIVQWLCAKDHSQTP